jgi:hypothetical protein
MCGFCSVWVFLQCVGVLVICVLVFTVFCIVSFMYIYSHLFCLYWCKDCCHRVTTQLQLIVVVVVVVVVVVIITIIETQNVILKGCEGMRWPKLT